jgi:hypothetical protein
MKKFVFLLNNDSIKLPEEFFDEDWEKINNKIKNSFFMRFL